MATMKQIREGLAANLSVLDGVQASPYVLSSPTPPCVYVKPAEVDYHRTFGAGVNGVKSYVFSVRAIVALGLDQGAQIKLDEFVSSGSVQTALEADKTLGGVAQNVEVNGMTDYAQVLLGDSQQAFMADFTVEVLA